MKLAVFALTAALAWSAAAEPRWPASFAPLTMPFRPADKATSRQNPPDFSWPAMPAASGYELQVARNAEFQGATTGQAAMNFHNFSQTFEPGVWFWRVRYRAKEGWSEWTPARRFRIAADAWKFPVPSIDELIKRVPSGHPRVWTTAAGLEEFRRRAAGPRKEWFARIEQQVRREIKTPPAPEPAFPFANVSPSARTAEWIAAHNRLRTQGEGAAERLMRTAFVYLVTDDRAIGMSAVEQAMNLARWNPEGPTGYVIHDQVHRAIAWKSAVAYDWCHGLMTPEQRRKLLEMIQSRTRTMSEHLVEKRPLAASPFDSHGWTAYGYLGIIATATLGDLPAAEPLFRAITPSYINLLAPWGGEDGGWIQGTAYWQYSQQSNKEFMDVLLSATGFSLYDKAHARNSGLFALYTLPPGSPRGHFGDGTEQKPNLYHVQHYRRAAQVYRDPLMQWAWRSIGDLNDYRLQHYFSGDESVPAEAPKGLAPSRWFRDIGWVSMHSALEDPERVSLHFKSSWIGSHNHSHADQNSFVLNAYGEALAIDAGYYDWYASPHDRNYTRQTVAHNAITHHGGIGQPIFDSTASGRINGFVHHGRFDAVSGDATAAYKGALAKAVRHIVYLRPDAFVVVDDLAATKAAPCEWRLNALRDVRLDNDGAGATVEQGKARLRVRLHSPAGITSASSGEFIGPPDVYAKGQKAVAFRPQGTYSSKPDQTHVCFSTPPAERTRIVTTLEPYRAGASAPPPVKVERGEGVMILYFKEDARVAVRMKDSGAVTAQGLTFEGAAMAISGTHVLLVEGTRLERGGVLLLSAERPVTAAVSPGSLEVSCGDDTSLNLDATGVQWVRQANGRELDREMWSAAERRLQLRLEPELHSIRYGGR